MTPNYILAACRYSYFSSGSLDCRWHIIVTDCRPNGKSSSIRNTNNEMIEIPEIIIFSQCDTRNVHRHNSHTYTHTSGGNMARHSKITPLRCELSKWSNKFHALQRMDRVECKKRHENMLSTFIKLGFSSALRLRKRRKHNNIDCIACRKKREKLLSACAQFSL